MTLTGKIANVETINHERHQIQEVLTEALRNLRFGEVVLNVHDGQVVQVTRVEKIRIKQAVSPEKRNR